MIRDIRPAVAPPRGGLPVPVMAGLLALVAVGMFVLLNGRQRALAHADLAQGPVLAPAPPPLVMAPAQAPAPPIMPLGSARVARLVVPARYGAAPTYGAHYAAPFRPQSGGVIPFAVPQPVDEIPPSGPRNSGMGHGGASQAALVYDTTTGPGGQVLGEGGHGATHGDGPDDAARASVIHGRGWLIPEGTILAAVLETPLVSDHPGLARAMITQDVRSFDGSRILIPRGSRLVGEFKGDAGAGQRRILVTWTRLIRSDGVAIRIASPASDPMGGAGIAGQVNTHFAERFAAAVLQSALSVGVNVASEAASSGTTALWLGGPMNGGAALGQGLMPTANRAATVKVREGAEIAVLVAHDLDFAGTPAWK